MKKRFQLFVALLTISIVITACPAAELPEPPDPPGPSLSGLHQFSNCEELTDFLEDSLDQPMYAEPFDANAPSIDGDSAGNTAEEASNEAPVTADTVEVEQADIVKYSGNRLYIINDQAGLIIYDVSNPFAPERLAQHDISIDPVELYVDGTQLTLIGHPRIIPSIYPPANSTAIQLIDLSDPTILNLVRQWNYPGNYSDSRKVGNSAYVVVRRTIWNDIIDNFVVDADNCQKIYAPVAMDEDVVYGITSWQVVGIDLRLSSEQDPQSITVLGGDRSQIAASPSRLYLTNYSYNQDETEIFVFALNSSNNAVNPQATSKVPGVIVNQFSMDEHAGHFRIATTTNRTTFGAADNRNYISVFKSDSNSFDLVGQNDTITPGESITAARFMGETAYLTTYVTKDPLLTVDLKDPTDPKILGELDVPGYASHIHVWGDLLISIGSTEEFWGEVILSLFDISDLNNPQLIEQLTIEDSYSSEAQREHRAFSFFEDRAILAIPIVSWSPSSSSSEMQLYKIGALGLTHLGGVNHSDLIDNANGERAPRLRRSLEIGAALYTISEAGIKANRFDDLENESFGEMFPGYEPLPDYGCYWECMGI